MVNPELSNKVKGFVEDLRNLGLSENSWNKPLAYFQVANQLPTNLRPAQIYLDFLYSYLFDTAQSHLKDKNKKGRKINEPEPKYYALGFNDILRARSNFEFYCKREGYNDTGMQRVEEIYRRYFPEQVKT